MSNRKLISIVKSFYYSAVTIGYITGFLTRQINKGYIFKEHYTGGIIPLSCNISVTSQALLKIRMKSNMLRGSRKNGNEGLSFADNIQGE
jgi:hypothetical protein